MSNYNLACKHLSHTYTYGTVYINEFCYTYFKIPVSFDLYGALSSRSNFVASVRYVDFCVYRFFLFFDNGLCGYWLTNIDAENGVHCCAVQYAVLYSIQYNVSMIYYSMYNI